MNTINYTNFQISRPHIRKCILINGNVLRKDGMMIIKQQLNSSLGGKEAWRPLHFPNKLSYGYLKFEGNGKFLWEGREKGV